MERTGKNRIDTLQSLRAGAFLCVFISHLGIIDAFGKLGVSIFMVLSGFLMEYSYWDRDLDCSIKSCCIFSWKKVRKLYALYFITMLLMALYQYGCIAIYTEVSREQIREILTGLGLGAFLLQAWSPKYCFSLNGAAWYLSAILFVYFLYPLVRREMKKLTNNRKAAEAIIAIYAIQFIFSYAVRNNENSAWFVYVFPVNRLLDFTVGCLTGYIFRNRNKQMRRGTATILEGMAIIYALFTVYAIYRKLPVYNRKWLSSTLMFTPITAVLVYLFAEGNGLFSRLFANPVILWLGETSKYAFLIHLVCIRYLSSIFLLMNAGISLRAYEMLSLAATLALSEVCLIAEKHLTCFSLRKIISDPQKTDSHSEARIRG